MNAKKLMAIGAHADDIELNIGGTLIKYRDLGYEVVYVMSTNNMSGGWSKLFPDGTRETRVPPYDEIMPQRKLEAARAAEFFGTEAIHLEHPQRHYTSKDGKHIELRYDNPRPGCVEPDTPTILTAHEDENSVRKLADLILTHSPEAVMTHGPIMVDMEHIGTCLLVTKAYWKAVDDGYEGTLLHWLHVEPTIYSKTFDRWDTFVDISGYQEKKLAAIGLHACQMPDPSRLDFIPWGEECGCVNAETFTIGGGLTDKLPESSFVHEIKEHRRL